MTLAVVVQPVVLPDNAVSVAQSYINMASFHLITLASLLVVYSMVHGACCQAVQTSHFAVLPASRADMAHLLDENDANDMQCMSIIAMKMLCDSSRDNGTHGMFKYVLDTRNAKV